MVCVYCGSETEVTNTRSRARLPSVWRRRQCKACVAQFSTIEAADLGGSYLVTYGDGGTAPFQRDVLFVSIMDALKHRPDNVTAAGALADTVIGTLLKSARSSRSSVQRGRFTTHDIATAAHQVLRRFDTFGAASYKAFHQAALKLS